MDKDEYAYLETVGAICEWCGVFLRSSDNPIKGFPCRCKECKEAGDDWEDRYGKIKFRKILPEGRHEKVVWLTMDELKERYPQHFKNEAVDE